MICTYDRLYLPVCLRVGAEAAAAVARVTGVPREVPVKHIISLRRLTCIACIECKQNGRYVTQWMRVEADMCILLNSAIRKNVFTSSSPMPRDVRRHPRPPTSPLEFSINIGFWVWDVIVPRFVVNLK